jgi:ribosomal protein L29
LRGECSFIKASGERCRGSATGQNGLCWSHDPANAEQRRKQASRAGKARSSKEIRELKEELKALISDVKKGDLDRNNAAVMVQAYRALKDFIELERRVRETDDLATEIEELKREYGIAG